MSTVAWWGMGVVCVAVVLYALHRLALWMERKGWIYYRKLGRGGAGNALMSVQAIMEPGVQHIVDARHTEDVAEDWQGDDEDSRDGR